MSTVAKRLLVFFVGVPVTLLLVFFRPYNHIALNLLIVAFSAGGAGEAFRLISARIPVANRGITITASVLLPFCAYFIGLAKLDAEYITLLFAVIAVSLFFTEIRCRDDFRDSVASLCGKLFIVFYTGYLVTYISRLTTSPNSVQIIAVFLLLVFVCDSAAWCFGMLLGKSNKGIFRASPNKSVAGFCGGYAGCIAVAVAAQRLMPDIFGTCTANAVVMGVIIATTSIAGDLVESVIKRSSGFKDSGTAIPGRGGVLDSLDSIVVSAPFYYFCTHFLFRI